MKRNTTLLLATAGLVLSAGLLQAQPVLKSADMMLAQGMMGPGMMGNGRMMGPGMGGDITRHRYVRANGIPPEYQSDRNPLPPNADNIAKGAQLYASSCASCHGARGDGEGPAQLNPPAPNLISAVQLPIATDAYLYWTIEEGGKPVGSAMPPFKEVLKPEQVWQIILYLRQL